MIGASLVLCAVLGQTPFSDPRELVTRLGAPRYTEREEASTALVRLGRPALNALMAARDDKDPEIRDRAGRLVNRIEGSLLTQPTMVRLQFEDRPLTEVVKSLADQTGLRLSLMPENAPQWNQRRVTVKEKDPLPFWKAIDRLCDAARLQYNVGMNGYAFGREPVFPLFDGGMRASLPVCDTGPFRVSVVGLHYQRDVSFPPMANPGGLPASGPAGGRPSAVNEQFYAQLTVAGEPRLAVSQTGALKIIEAVDDRGQSLSPDARPGMAQRTSGYFGMNAGSALQVQATLTRPEQPGKLIRRLRGSVPVAVSTRKPQPLVVTLAGAAGKTFRNDDVTLTVHDVRPLGNTRQTSIDLTVRPSTTQAASVPAPGSPTFGMPRHENFQQQIEVLDAKGRTLPWYQTSFDSEAGRMTLTLTPPGLEGPAAPAQVRYFGMARAAAEVAFDFRDLPLP